MVEELDANFDNDDKEDNTSGAAGENKKPTSVGLKDAFKKTGEKGDEQATGEGESGSDG